MKKIILFVAFLGLVSCSSDDNGGSVSDGSNVVGNWKPTSLTYDGVSTMSMQGQTITTNFNAVATDFHDATVTFHQNGTFSSVGDGYTVDLTMEVMGQEMTQETSVGSFFEDGTWEIDGNTMIMTNTSSNEPVTYNIVALNATTMKLSIDNYTTQMNGGQATINVDITLTKI